MKYNKILILKLISIHFIFWGCSSSVKKNKIEDFVFISQKVIPMDTLCFKLPKKINIGDGFCKMNGDSIYFFDEVNCNVHSFDKEGHYVKKYLNKGRGPGELQSIQNYLNFNNNHIIMYGYDILLFDRVWRHLSSSHIYFNSITNIQELSRNPKPEYQGIYEVKYFQNQITKYDSIHILFNIESTHPRYNAFITEDYYKNGRILACCNILTGKVDTIFGRRSSKYLDYEYIPNYDFFYYEFIDDTFYINYEPDHLIYVMNKNFNLLYSFGVEGIAMKTNYAETCNLNKAFDRNKFIIDRTEKGYYTDLKVFPKDEIVFRTYTQGINIDCVDSYNQNPKRMQVYKKFKLVADSPIPYKFKLLVILLHIIMLKDSLTANPIPLLFIDLKYDYENVLFVFAGFVCVLRHTKVKSTIYYFRTNNRFVHLRTGKFCKCFNTERFKQLCGK